MGQFGIGQSVRRSEDFRFLTGAGRYIDDINLDGQVYMVVVRSPFARARIAGLDAEDARAAPGVLAVYTHADLDTARIGAINCPIKVESRDGSPAVKPPYPALATGEARHVGDAVAVVVAETLAEARDASELVMVEYEELAPVVDTSAATAPDAPQVRDEAPGNLCFDWETGDAAAVEAAFAEAEKTVSVELVNNRIVVNPMEPRGALGLVDESGRLVLHTATQGSHGIRNQLANDIFKLPPDRVRVVTPDVGGGFGMKIFLFPEQIMVLFAARELGRPVKWTGDRSEAFAADSHGRDHVTKAEMALDADNRVLGVRVDTLANLGAYLSNFSIFIPTACGIAMLNGVYRIPAIHAVVRGVFTNTAPVDAYRGAGRPEALYVIERLMDKAARELGLGADEIRSLNFIRPEDMPWTTPLNESYDSGEFETNMRQAMRNADWDGFEARRAEAAKAGRLRGIGLGYYVEACGGGFPESAEIRVSGAGDVDILIGTQSNGQGHETAYAQVAEEVLDVPFERIRVIQGDTDAIETGRGTGGSRSIPVGAPAVRNAASVLVERARKLAADMLETAEADIEFSGGRFTIVGTDRSVVLSEVAAKAEKDGEPLSGKDDFKPPRKTYPNGCHVCELEIDRDTGSVDVLRYTIVDDFGVVLNPMLIAGQVHGGVAQGIGQALHECTVYDPENGQLLSGSFMDYAMPRADSLPFIDFNLREVPCKTNPLGLKGAGEAGAVGAPPTVMAAIIDALSPLGPVEVDMPATPARLWAIIAGRRAAA